MLGGFNSKVFRPNQNVTIKMNLQTEQNHPYGVVCICFSGWSRLAIDYGSFEEVIKCDRDLIHPS